MALALRGRIHISHQFELLKLYPEIRFDYLINHTRRWGDQARPMPKHLNWVTHYEKGRYDLAILHVDQQCLLPDLGKSVLFREVREQVTDIPIIVVNHGTPTYPERFNQCAKEAGMEENEQAGIEWARKEMRKLLEGVDVMVVNSYQAAEEWGWGVPIIHGLDPDEWWDLPKEPRIVTFISPGGMGNKYYGRLLFGETRNILREKYGMELVWIGEEKVCKDWDDYRDFLGRSLVYFNPTFGSPMPRTRSESMLCLKKGSKVINADDFSFKNIEDVKIGDKIIDKQGKKSKVIQVHKKKYEGDFYRLNIYGYQSIECSGEHKFWAIKTSKFINKYGNGTICRPDTRERNKYIKRDFESLRPQWIEVSKIRKGDCILSPSKFDIDGDEFIRISDYVKSDKIVMRDGYIRWRGCYNNLPEICKQQSCSYFWIKECLRRNRYPGEKSQKFLRYLQEGGYQDIGFFKNKFKITKEFSKFIGYYIAEGYTQKSTIKLCFHQNETEYHNDVVKLIKKVFGLEAKIIERSNNRTEVVFNNNLIAKFLESACGKGAKNKIIPKELVNSKNDEIIINLLAGLYRGDGHIGNEASYCSISGKLVYQIYFLLKRLGIHGTITCYKSYRYNKQNQDSYHIRSYGTYKDIIRSIVDDLKFIDKRHKGHSYFNYDGYWYHIVKDVGKFNYRGMIYDLTTKSHSYLVNGLITHNSGCCVVTTKYHDADRFIKDGVNGFLIKNNPEDAAKRLAWCMEHYRECVEIGKRGRETAIEKFHISRFKRQWMELIRDVLSK